MLAIAFILMLFNSIWSYKYDYYSVINLQTRVFLGILYQFLRNFTCSGKEETLILKKKIGEALFVNQNILQVLSLGILFDYSGIGHGSSMLRHVPWIRLNGPKKNPLPD